MSELSLRAYGREIDELIERERLDEAIAHCRYILQTYSKHLETYRLLGKAYLEAKRYGDAADIFQRVLSAIPDDFVSHVGMAIVREDEGNLDAAIWHMERAFETNPSNPAIQQEMKRLISRRDGLEPHKVRLTRGALARMYAHGELFAQAITELRSALQEDAERPDLQVLLASMYWQTDQRSDAIAISNQILEKLPYCAEANRIQAANLQANDRVEEAAVYHRRLASLDPYAAFVESALADANSVEDSAVSLEKLDWVPGEALPSTATGQPSWAAKLGMEMQKPSEDSAEEVKPAQTGPLPSWLEPGEPPPFEAAAEKELRQEMEAQAADTSEGVPGSGFLAELESETSDDADLFVSEPEQEAEPSKSDLSASGDLATGIPAGGSEDGSEETMEGEAAGAVAGMFDAPEDSEPSTDGPKIADAESVGEPEESLTSDGDDESSSVAPVTSELAANGDTEEAAGSDIPSWMQEAGWKESSGEVEEAPVSFSDQDLEALEAGNIPADDQADEDAELAPAELPDWIHDIAPEELEGSADGAADEGPPSWIGSEASPEAKEPADDTVAPTKESEGEASFPTAEADTSGLPTWISDDAPGATETIVTWLEDRGPDSSEEEVGKGDDLPDWMRDTGPIQESLDAGLVEAEQEVAPPPEPSTEEPAAATPEEPGPETPSSENWLSAVAAAAAEEEAQPSSSDPAVAASPDWLSEAVETPEDSVAPEIEQDDLAVSAEVDVPAGEGQERPLSPEESSLAPEEATLDADPGLERDVESELAPAGESREQPPGLSEDTAPSEAELIEQETTSVEAEAKASGMDSPSFAAAAEMVNPTAGSGDSSAPDWLEEIGTPPKQPVETDSADWLDGMEMEGEETPATPKPETPEWLKGLADEGADGDSSSATSAPDWLREIGDPGSVSQEADAASAEPETEITEEPESEASGGAPDWLQGIGSVTDEDAPADIEEISPPEEQEPEIPQVPVEEDDEVMEWLEDLAAKQAEAPGDEDLETAAEVVPSAPLLEDRDIPDEPEEGLEWLEQLADQRGMDVDVGLPGQAAAEVKTPEPEPEPDTAPDWLGRMATQPLPKVDMEALDAAAQGEEVSPDAETVEAQTPDFQAQLEEFTREREIAEEAPGEPAPDDVTIDARAGDLQDQMEAAEREAEAVDEASDEVEPEDAIPDWLIAAAEQTAVSTAAPSNLPEEFAERPEPAQEDRLAEPTPVGEPEDLTELAEPSQSETVTATSRSVTEVEESAKDMPSQAVAASETEEKQVGPVAPEQPAEPEVAEPEQPAGPEVAELSEPVEPGQAAEPEVAEPEQPAGPEVAELSKPVQPEQAAEPEVAEPEQPAEPVEVVRPAESIAAETVPVAVSETIPEEAPAPETKRSEDVLERSRQALASGDTQVAVELYGDLVKRKKSLESVIEDLRIAVDRTPDNPDLWQVLGDAYMRDDQTDEAINAYRKGMETA
ncbi:MAG: tetratricopeptide repeat protein [Chloroflexi bacterium]|nr:tetratricopeptide repeat protein [Chloroflexota bacterium]